MRLLRYNKKFFSEEEDGGPSLSGVVGGGAAIAGAGLGATAAGYYGASRMNYNKAKLKTGYGDFYKNLSEETKKAQESVTSEIEAKTNEINKTRSNKVKAAKTEQLNQLHDKMSNVKKDVADKVVADSTKNKASASSLSKSISQRGTAMKLGKTAAIVGGIGLGLYGLSKLGGSSKKPEEKAYSVLEKSFGAVSKIVQGATKKSKKDGVKNIVDGAVTSLKKWWGSAGTLEKTGAIGGTAVTTGIAGGSLLAR